MYCGIPDLEIIPLEKTLECNLNISQQCNMAAKNGNTILVFIRYSMYCNFQVMEEMVTLYSALPRPFLEYCVKL